MDTVFPDESGSCIQHGTNFHRDNVATAQESLLEQDTSHRLAQQLMNSEVVSDPASMPFFFIWSQRTHESCSCQVFCTQLVSEGLWFSAPYWNPIKSPKERNLGHLLTHPTRNAVCRTWQLADIEPAHHLQVGRLRFRSSGSTTDSWYIHPRLASPRPRSLMDLEGQDP